MTVQNQYAAEKTDWTGSETEIDFIFEILGADQFQVWLETETEVIGTYTRQQVGAQDYRLDLNGGDPTSVGGTVTLTGDVPDTVDRISVERNTRITQNVDLQNFQSFRMKDLEYILDKLTMIVQEMLEAKCGVQGLFGPTQLISFEPYAVLSEAMANNTLEIIVYYISILQTYAEDCTPLVPSAAIVLNFEDIRPVYETPYTSTAVLEFYNGGVSGDGTSGVDYGVSFGSAALCIGLNDETILTVGTQVSNASAGGLGDPTSDRGALFFLDTSNIYINVEAGFETSISFKYAAINQAGFVQLYDGLNGTGNLLATLNMGTTISDPQPGYLGSFQPFSSAGLAFEGVAKSVDFSGVANQIIFDDVILGGPYNDN